MKKRILLLEFRQETNTFNPIVAGRSDFNAGTPAEGAALLRHRMSTYSALRGAADAFGEDAEFIPSVFMAAPSGGRVADSILQYVLERLEYYVRNNSFDAIYASLHGAANLNQLHWTKLPQGLFPFVENIAPEAAQIV